MWNSLALDCPDEDLCEYQLQDQCLIKELHNFVTVLRTAANALTSEGPMHAEIEILKDVQRKFKRILRCDRLLVHLYRIITCTKKMILLNLSKSYLDLAERFLVQLQKSSLIWHLPSKEELEYLLIRTLSASKLACQGIKYSQDAFSFILQKLKVGHYVIDLMTAASLIARLSFLFKATVEQLCPMYQKIEAWRYKLKPGTYQWSQDPDFPQDLRKWLESSDSETLESISVPNTSTEILSSVLKLQSKQRENKDSDFESVAIADEIMHVEDTIVRIPSSAADIDYGEIIPRKEIKESHRLSSKQKQILQDILHLENLNKLENMWSTIQNFPISILPKRLSNKKKRVVNNMFTHIKTLISSKKFNRPIFMKMVSFAFSKHLGFTEEEIETCRNSLCEQATPNISSTTEEFPEVNLFAVKTSLKCTESKLDAGELAPVKTLKELRELYNKLCEMHKNDAIKLCKLKKLFQRKRANILLLKESGDKLTAKKLIFITSNLLLARYKK